MEGLVGVFCPYHVEINFHYGRRIWWRLARQMARMRIGLNLFSKKNWVVVGRLDFGWIVGLE
jgi:hypothetical protein